MAFKAQSISKIGKFLRNYYFEWSKIRTQAQLNFNVPLGKYKYLFWQYLLLQFYKN